MIYVLLNFLLDCFKIIYIWRTFRTFFSPKMHLFPRSFFIIAPTSPPFSATLSTWSVFFRHFQVIIVFVKKDGETFGGMRKKV